MTMISKYARVPEGRAAGTIRRGTVIVVVGAAGGAGTSTFAAILARVLAGRAGGQGPLTRRRPAAGRSTVVMERAGGLGADGPVSAENTVPPVDLVVTDPSRPGLDMILGLEEEPGPRWQDIHAPLGVVDGPTLAARLPAADGVRVLAGRPWTGPAPHPWEQDAVWEALLGLPGSLVLDAGQGDPQTGHPLPEVFSRASQGMPDGGGAGSPAFLLLVPPDFAALAAAQRIVAGTLGDFPAARLGAVVSRIGPLCRGRRTESGFSDGDVADILGIPVIGRYRRSPRLVRRIEAGAGLEEMPASIVRQFDRFLARLAALPAGSSGSARLSAGSLEGRHAR